MNGLTMEYQLTVPAMLRRAEALHGPREIVSRRPDRSLHRYTYADFVRRAKQLAAALRELGVRPGERVATLAWNNYQHLEAYFGVPLCGGVLHTLNLRLHPDELAYVVDHADDRVILVDEVLLPLYEKIAGRVHLAHVIVVAESGAAREGMLDYETLLAAADVTSFTYPEPDEREAAAMCYTSGTTGRSKGVVYSHRAIVLHSMALAMADTLGLGEADTVMPVVPMFHANAWGLPFTCVLVGAKQVFPGPFLDPISLLELCQAERVTLTGGVPTIWLGLLQVLDKDPGAYDLSSLHTLVVGGSAAPAAMIRGFEERHGLRVLHAWGMTEMAPVGSISRLTTDLHDVPAETRYAYRAKQGRPVPFIEIRARGEEGFVPWDGQSMGELEVRGPWVAAAYHDSADGGAQFTQDGWFRTGDVVTIDPRGYIELKDRAKDLIKSGGEWISSVALENALMGHPAVAEAAVIPVAHPKWQERPLACVVLKEGQVVTADELRAFLEPHVARWWLPDAVVFVAEIPRTSTGKFRKCALREQYRDFYARPAHEIAERQPAPDTAETRP